jgi:hypothetical protein
MHFSPARGWTPHARRTIAIALAALCLVTTTTSGAAERPPASQEPTESMGGGGLSRTIDREVGRPETPTSVAADGWTRRDGSGSTATLPRSSGQPVTFRSPTGEVLLTLALPKRGPSVSAVEDSPGRIRFGRSSDAFSTIAQLNTGANASASIMTVINSPSAPTTYRFETTMPPRMYLALDRSGAVELRDRDVVAPEEAAVAVIDQPWARAADGRAVPVHYELDGTALVLVVEHTGSAYPVVADPNVTTNCGIATCSIYWSRSRSRSINDWAVLMTPGLALASFGCPYAPAGADRDACYVVAYGSYAGYVAPISQITLGYILNDAAANWKCFKITRTRGIGAPTYVSTNNGTYCKSF